MSQYAKVFEAMSANGRFILGGDAVADGRNAGWIAIRPNIRRRRTGGWWHVDIDQSPTRSVELRSCVTL